MVLSSSCSYLLKKKFAEAEDITTDSGRLLLCIPVPIMVQYIYFYLFTSINRCTAPEINEGFLELFIGR